MTNTPSTASKATAAAHQSPHATRTCKHFLGVLGAMLTGCIACCSSLRAASTPHFDRVVAHASLCFVGQVADEHSIWRDGKIITQTLWEIDDLWFARSAARKQLNNAYNGQQTVLLEREGGRRDGLVQWSSAFVQPPQDGSVMLCANKGSHALRQAHNAAMFHVWLPTCEHCQVTPVRSDRLPQALRNSLPPTLGELRQRVQEIADAEH